MFTGIIEQTALVTNIKQADGNLTFTLQTDIAYELKPDQSVSHNGVCLTVERINGNTYEVTAIADAMKGKTV